MDNQNNISDADTNSILPVLKKIPLFANLDENLHKQIIKHIVLMYYPANYPIFREGEVGDGLYVIRKGKIRITRAQKDGGVLPENIALLGDGEFFGEMSLIAEVPHTAEARTVDESEVFVLSKDHFKEFLNTNPILAGQISAKVVERTNENDKQI